MKRLTALILSLLSPIASMGGQSSCEGKTFEGVRLAVENAEEEGTVEYLSLEDREALQKSLVQSLWREGRYELKDTESSFICGTSRDG